MNLRTNAKSDPGILTDGGTGWNTIATSTATMPIFMVFNIHLQIYFLF